MMARQASKLLVLSVVVLAWFSPTGLHAQEPLSPSPAFVEALEEAEALMEEREYKAAIKALKKARGLSIEPSAQVLLDLAICFNRTREFDKAEKYARATLKVAKSPADRAGAYNMLSVSILGSVDSDPGRLKEAEAALRQVLKLTGGSANVVRFNLAQVLVRLERPDEAVALLEEFLQREPEGQHSEDAKRFMHWVACTNDLRPPESVDAAEPSVPSEDAPDRPFQVGGDMNPPRKIHAPQPQYTESARKARIQGVVIVMTIIDHEGYVTSRRLLSGLDADLDRRVLDTICRWQFEPATLADGRPVSVYYTLTVNFQLRGQ